MDIFGRFLLLSLLFGLPAGVLAEIPCDEYFSESRIWHPVTARPDSMVETVLNHGVEASSLDLYGGPFSAANILEKNLSIFSLGEGGSNLIYNLLEAGLKNVYASDVIYGDAAILKELPDIANSRLAKYPAHYLPLHFQDLGKLDLATLGIAEGFDEIVSSHSLGYILGGVPLHLQEDDTILRSVIKLLKPGGVLRVGPVYEGHFNETFGALS
jgi:hypothetical protein